MNFIEWLQFVYAVCTSAEAPVRWREIAIGANLAIAVAYFWIPLVMAIVFKRWQREIPFPWLWAGFVIFIAACGTSHVMHAIHGATEQTPYNALKLSILVFTAIVSIATALGFTFILPRVLTLTSPAAARHRLETAVQAATADLERALQHEKLLLREVHHRVKNNLQVTASLVNLHIRRSRLSDTSELAALRNRIIAMAEVHDQLQVAGTSPFSVSRFAATLCDRLSLSHGREDIVCTVEGADFDVSLDHAAALALIFNEVLSNAFQHAFDEGRPGSIRVELAETATERLVTISDNGRGLPDDDSSGGIGTVLISSLAVQLGATYEWQTGPDGGTTFLLKIAR